MSERFRAGIVGNMLFATMSAGRREKRGVWRVFLVWAVIGVFLGTAAFHIVNEIGACK